jgi:hypothetical protein
MALPFAPQSMKTKNPILFSTKNELTSVRTFSLEIAARVEVLWNVRSAANSRQQQFILQSAVIQTKSQKTRVYYLHVQQ